LGQKHPGKAAGSSLAWVTQEVLISQDLIYVLMSREKPSIEFGVPVNRVALAKLFQNRVRVFAKRRIEGRELKTGGDGLGQGGVLRRVGRE
jgi:hypothetical protein